jgi:Ca2+-binding RTX toxin-like protein
VADLLAFLQSLTQVPFAMTPASPSPLSFGEQGVDAGATPSRTVLVTNTGSAPIAVTAAIINGPDVAHFSITYLPPATPFSPGESRAVGVAFDPAVPGALTATLELTTIDVADGWTVGVPLIGRGSEGTGVAPEIPPEITARCFGVQATIVGTNGPDRLNGTPGRDIIAALGGNDVINGRGGNDFLCGGKGNDQIRGRTGKDRLDGGVAGISSMEVGIRTGV